MVLSWLKPRSSRYKTSPSRRKIIHMVLSQIICLVNSYRIWSRYVVSIWIKGRISEWTWEEIINLRYWRVGGIYLFLPMDRKILGQEIWWCKRTYTWICTKYNTHKWWPNFKHATKNMNKYQANSKTLWPYAKYFWCPINTFVATNRTLNSMVTFGFQLNLFSYIISR